MGRKRFPYTRPLKLTKTGSGIEYIDDDPVKPGRVLVLKTIAVEDETSALTYVRIGKRTGGYDHVWEEEKNPAAGEVSFSTEEHWIREGEHFRAILSGGAANDICRAYLDGYWMTWEED